MHPTNLSIIFLFVFVNACVSGRKTTVPVTNVFPFVMVKVEHLPPKEKFYIYLMAGQSNMAGRGIISSEDTITHPNVLTLDKNNQWVYAKEPLHYYEPTRTGLDCGLSFGKELSKQFGKEITIGLVPCAVGGSSIEQWLADSVYRNVQLYSNFMDKVNLAMQSGTIKGMLWHQGEANTGSLNYNNYKSKLESFVQKLRKDIGIPNLPVYAGELASFLNANKYPNAKFINNDLHAISKTLYNFYVIKTSDLEPLKDSVHFNSKAQREMGKRFARAVMRNQ